MYVRFVRFLGATRSIDPQLTGEQKDLRAFGSTLKGGLHEGREAQDISRVHLDVRTPLQKDVEALGLSCRHET